MSPNEWDVCSSHTCFYILRHHTSHTTHTHCPLEGYETMNDKRCVVLWLCVTCDFELLAHFENCVHRCELTETWSIGYCIRAQIQATSHPNKIIKKKFGQQQIALPVARRNIIYATNRDILLYYYFVIQNSNHFLFFPLLFFHWQLPIRFHSPMRRKYSMERIRK